MSLILNIDTASGNASICIARDGLSVGVVENGEQKDHASWIHPAIEKLLGNAGYTIRDINAVAVTSGPGSYTGLRVGMSTAKGLCYALNIPLITENTLRVMALAMKQSVKAELNERILFCPMIDARRMEVFTALFNTTLDEVVPSCALVLHRDIFAENLSESRIIFSGNGYKKFQQLINHANAIFLDVHYSAVHLAILSNTKFAGHEFDDIAYAEPLYLKEFYTVPKK